MDTPVKPEMLYYNCGNPVAILQERLIKRSSVFKGKYRGVSMSAWEQLGSHGPFKIAFCRAPWFDQFKAIVYGNPDMGYKNEMFKDEQEWYSEEEVRFDMRDILWIAFMVNAPCVLSKVKVLEAKYYLAYEHGNLYNEMTADDPYLNRSHQLNHV